MHTPKITIDHDHKDNCINVKYSTYSTKYVQLMYVPIFMYNQTNKFTSLSLHLYSAMCTASVVCDLLCIYVYV